MALHVLDEANRCLGCKKPLCQQGCPIHTNIPEVIRLLKAKTRCDQQQPSANDHSTFRASHDNGVSAYPVYRWPAAQNQT